jgi:hypothetical protein
VSCPGLVKILHVLVLAPIWPYHHPCILTKLFHAHVLPHIHAAAYYRSVAFRCPALASSIILHVLGSNLAVLTLLHADQAISAHVLPQVQAAAYSRCVAYSWMSDN